jgi:uncharacterized membrane protein
MYHLKAKAMRDIKIVHLIYTFGVGLFAGLLYTFEQGVLPMLNTLSGPEYASVEQGLIRNLDAFPFGVIAVSSLSMLLPLYTLIRLRQQRNTLFWRLTAIAWVLFFFGVGVFTIALNVPINNYVLQWDVANPPADWEAARANWGMLNKIRTPINYLSFLLLIWAAFSIPDSSSHSR